MSIYFEVSSKSPAKKKTKKKGGSKTTSKKVSVVKKQRVFFRRLRNLRGSITRTKINDIPHDSYSGELGISKIYFNTPIVIDGTRHRSICEICTNRYVCFSEKKANPNNCQNWLASSICAGCTRYSECYPSKESTCKKRARDFSHASQYGFILDRSIQVPVTKNEDLENTFDLAMKIGRKNRVITWLLKSLAEKDKSLYHSWEIEKKNGGTRIITAPTGILKWMQKSILERSLYDIPTHPSATGFIPGSSIADNAREHCNSDVVVSIDLENFFPSISFPRVYGVLKAVGFTPRIAGVITSLCTWKGALPQGAPTSPMLSNMVSYRMDQKLKSYFSKRGWKYTRYADDITFSYACKKDEKMGPVDGVIQVVRKIVEEEGFKVNEKKTKIMRKGRRQWVTGLVANEKPNILRRQFRMVRAAIHNASTHGLEKAAKKRGISNIKYEQWVSGNIAFFEMVVPKRVKAMKKKWKTAVKGKV